MKIYSTDCPKCHILEKKLQNKHIEFETILNFDPAKLLNLGFTTAPVLELDDGTMLNFADANTYINTI